MNLSTALNSAMSGLQLTSRSAQVVADNIANVNTEGYGVRVLTQAARVTGQTGNGVMATGIQRDADPVLLREARLAAAELGGVSRIMDFRQSFEDHLGVPGSPGALITRLTGFENALERAIVQPESPAMLQAVAQTASSVVSKLQELDTVLMQARDRADAQIATDVEQLNTFLVQIDRLNRDIQRQILKGDSPNALFDQRQRLIDEAGAIVPLTEIPREDGRVMLLGAGGVILLDKDPAQLEFRRTPFPAQDETVQNGALSRLSVNGRDLPDGAPVFASGSLGASLQLRDLIVPSMHGQLDTLAHDLVVRFSDNPADTSLPPGAFGLFALSGLTTPPADPTGVAARLQLSGQIDLIDSASLGRLRDGLFAGAGGAVSENAVLVGLRDALTDSTLSLQTGGRMASFLGHVTAFQSEATSRRLAAETDLGIAATRADTLDQALRARGVDSDAELQRLLVLEKAYAANARVISAVDGMLRRLLEL